MAGTLIFRYSPGSSFLHRTDTRIKLAGMIALSLVLVRVSPYKLLLLMPLLSAALVMTREKKASILRPPLFLLIMPLIIFTGNFSSLYFSQGGSITAALASGTLRMGAFISILMLAQLFIGSTDPLGIAPALYRFFKYIPLIPARELSMRMGLSLSLIPLILDEMNEIRDAMISRCGWNPAHPLRNLFHMGLPLLNGILLKAEALADAMESRCYNEDATEPEIPIAGFIIIPLLSLLFLLIILFLPEFLPRESFYLSYMFRYY